MDKKTIFFITLILLVIPNFSMAAQPVYKQIDVDPDLYYRGIFKYDDHYLIKAEKYYYPEKRYIYYFLNYQAPNKPLVIMEGYETCDMAENDEAYFTLIRKKYDVLLMKRNKLGDAKWKIVKRTFVQPSDPMDLEVSGERVVMVTPESVYHNFRRAKAFDEWKAPKVNSGTYGFNIFFKEHSVVRLTQDGVVIGNNLGEWGGSLFKLTYRRWGNQFDYKRLSIAHINSIERLSDGSFYVLDFCSHMDQLSNGLFELKDEALTPIYTQYGHSDRENGVQYREDPYHWWDEIQGEPIVSVKVYRDTTYFLVAGKGVYRINRDFSISLVIKLVPFESYEFKTDENEPYLVTDGARDFEIIDNRVFLLHYLPIIEEAKL